MSLAKTIYEVRQLRVNRVLGRVQDWHYLRYMTVNQALESRAVLINLIAKKALRNQLET